MVALCYGGGRPPHGGPFHGGEGPPKIFRKTIKNHWKIMVFGVQEGHPCVPYTRADILVAGNPWGMLLKLSFDDFRISMGGAPPPNFYGGMKNQGGRVPP